ncbi:hypothetical protein H6F75_01040 [Nodosilinea sp. FACHB-131]|uniref:hypothetical protein n=1 Tax=Cyanophyceae TaxID=3028117 RepID=UPI001685728C|nr:hypothetical protein [Nodosilinea sp. FACHB-131]MBD1872055.1 hypothetical protein [Nodosilinea sp. FACHB-131]
MFEYLEPDASGASHIPPSHSAQPQPRPERVRHLLYGSLVGIDRTIKILHAYGYADPNDWSDPIPVPPNSGASSAALSEGMTWMVILTKTLLIE